MTFYRVIGVGLGLFNIGTAFVQLSLYVKLRTPDHEDVWRLLVGYGAKRCEALDDFKSGG